MKALLRIAAKVQHDARTVSPDDISNAKNEGASEQEIHDTVLIAASFCMFNRYVDGLATNQPPQADAFYRHRAEDVAKFGYMIMDV